MVRGAKIEPARGGRARGIREKAPWLSSYNSDASQNYQLQWLTCFLRRIEQLSCEMRMLSQHLVQA